MDKLFPKDCYIGALDISPYFQSSSLLLAKDAWRDSEVRIRLCFPPNPEHRVILEDLSSLYLLPEISAFLFDKGFTGKLVRDGVLGESVYWSAASARGLSITSSIRLILTRRQFIVGSFLHE